MGKPGDGTIEQFVIENVGGTLQHASGTTVELDTEYLLVLRADFALNGNDFFTLYVNPTPDEPEPTSGTIKNDFDFGVFEDIYLYSTGAFSIDEIRVGSSYADVVPFQPLPGDFNRNGIVDAADYTLWRDNLGSANALPNDDTTGAGADDYDRWKTNFGQSDASHGSSVAVPEPTSATLLFVVAPLVIHAGKRRLPV